MKVTAIVKNATKNEVMNHCCMGFEYEQVGNDVTILYYSKTDAVFDLTGIGKECEIQKGWDFVDLITGKPCKNLSSIG